MFRQGASPEEIAVELENAENALRTHQQQIKEIHNLNQVSTVSFQIDITLTFHA
jgi:hypothetical protein